MNFSLFAVGTARLLVADNPGSGATSFPLHRRTLYVSVRTIDATIAGFWFQQSATALAVVIILARIGWHQVP
jgi:hypothetical protein